MREDSKRSYTAEVVAALRAMGARVRDPDLRDPDTMAERMIGWQYRFCVRVAPLRRPFVAVFEGLLPGLLPFVTARTRHLDAALLQEVRAGARQVVILGAGGDSRAYRFADELADVRVYEVDHPATSEWKRRQVTRLFGTLPKRVTYVPADLSTQKLDDALSNVDRTVRTVFLWEGVAPYLPPEAIDATLTSIARFAAGSSVVFDYAHQDVLDSPAPEMRKFLWFLERRGEPILSGLEPATLGEYVATFGLELVDDAGPDELRRRDLSGTTKHITPILSIAHVRVPA